MITIRGVNEFQRSMLDHMWTLDDYDDVLEWKDDLSDHDRQQADLLEQMILLSVMDELIKDDGDCTEANEIIKSITNKFTS